jgi:hypothetical protein
MKILKLHFTNQRNEAHLQFLFLVRRLLDRHAEVIVIVSDLLPEFYEGIDLKARLVDAVKGSVYTEELADADRRVDRAIVGINSTVNAALHHPNEAIERAAKAIAILLKAFRGSIEKKSYEEEQAAVKILVNDLQTTYAQQVATIGMGEWVVEKEITFNIV